jgi:NADH dehydrogenase
MLDFIRQAHGFYANLRDVEPKVVLVHSREELLGEIGADLGSYARTVLGKRGVDVRLGVRVSAVTSSRVLLADGASIDANTIVSTIGSGPNPVVMDLCKQIGVEAAKGRVPTDAFMHVAGMDTLWAAGDGASVPWNDRGTAKVSPPTAQFALRQGAALGRNIAAVLKRRPLRPFAYRYMGQLASIGERAAVAEVFGFHFKGFFAWWMWRTIYLAKLPGLIRKLRVMTDWTFDLVFPRDISQLLPPPDEIVRAVHLEKGDPLFEMGSPCRSFFFVRHGSLAVSTPGLPARIVPMGSVIDQSELDSSNLWEATAVAAEACDLLVFQGRLLEYLQRDLRISKRE